MIHELLKEQCEAIERESADDTGTQFLEFYVPSVSKLSGEFDDATDLLGDDGDDYDSESSKPSVRFFAGGESEKADLNADLRQFAIDGLRKMGSGLLAAADRIEAAAGGGVKDGVN